MAKKEVDPLAWMKRAQKPVKPHTLSKDEVLFQQHERELATSVGGRQTAGSGNKSDKGDVKTDDYRIEAKSTAKKSLSVKAEWLDKITREALDTGRLPLVSLLFDVLEEPTSKRWILIEESHFKELTGIE